MIFHFLKITPLDELRESSVELLAAYVEWKFGFSCFSIESQRWEINSTSMCMWEVLTLLLQHLTVEQIQPIEHWIAWKCVGELK